MKNYDQSKKAKEKFLQTSPIAHLMMTGDAKRVFTRDELTTIVGICDRAIRREVAEMANYLPILSLSKEKGYRVLCFNEETTIEDLERMHEELQHQINENKSRIDNLKARMKPLVALQKVIEKKLGEKNGN